MLRGAIEAHDGVSQIPPGRLLRSLDSTRRPTSPNPRRDCPRFAGSVTTKGSDLSNDMELDPVKERSIADWPSMGGTSSESLEVCFASSADIGVVDGEKGDQFDRVDFDTAIAHAVATARSHLRSPP